MDFRTRYDRGYGIQRIHDPESAVVIHAEVAIVGVGVLPRNNEHRIALIAQIADERVPGRQIEDVVLHDPGGHDKDGFGLHRVRRRRILDQFDEAVAIHDLARGHAEVTADLERLGAGGLFAAGKALEVVEKVLRAAHEVHACLLDGALQDLRIRRDEVRWREHIEPLAGRELDDVFVLPGNPPHPRRGVVPPLLGEQEALMDQVVRPGMPRLAVETMVLR